MTYALKSSLLGMANDQPEAAEFSDNDTLCPPPKSTGAMFYGLVGDVAHAAAEGTEVNPVGAALAYLTFLSANVGRDVYIPIGNTIHHPRLFGLHVGRSARAGKGDSQQLTHRIRRSLENSHPGLLGRTHTGGLSSREGLALLIHDGYKEGKQEIPPVADKRLWIVESEFANVLQQSARHGNTLSAALRDSFDGNDLIPATKTNRVGATDPHIAMLGNVTPSEELGLMEKNELSNGFANRFLHIFAENIGLVPFPQPTPDDIVLNLASRTAEVVSFALGDYPVAKNSRRMALSDTAAALYTKAYPALRRPKGNELLAGLLERMAPYALRLASLFALTDLTLTIQESHMRTALAWVKYAEDSVRFIFAERAGMAAAMQTESDAAKILEYLQQNPLGATSTEINYELFKRNLSSGRINDALKALLTSNPPKIELNEEPRRDGKTQGRLVKRYRVFSGATIKTILTTFDELRGLDQDSHVTIKTNFQNDISDSPPQDDGQNIVMSFLSYPTDVASTLEPEPNIVNVVNIVEGEL